MIKVNCVTCRKKEGAEGKRNAGGMGIQAERDINLYKGIEAGTRKDKSRKDKQAKTAGYACIAINYCVAPGQGVPHHLDCPGNPCLPTGYPLCAEPGLTYLRSDNWTIQNLALARPDGVLVLIQPSGHGQGKCSSVGSDSRDMRDNQRNGDKCWR
ncbi:hypothetical protein ElyMa_005997500 [Elysia marginata]|uniref:Uncharacterized protein n=1 Tax=Elysia marginata TaxID=1093978 RepID=A0AAV4GGC5_9GAST|nr:hypothetical protein ElyMa_005997500 [Elysia marginata]